MGLRSVVFLAVAAFAVSAAANGLQFPELARDRSASRIVSGWDARIGQFPYIFSLRMVNAEGGVSACGGTIIHAEWGLSAAHCTATRFSFVIRLGVVELTRPEVIFETTEFYNHPLYDNDRQSVVQPNDVALIRFGRSIQFSANIQPIRLQSSVDANRNYNGQRLTASGWGRTWTSPEGASPSHLQWVHLTAVSNWACLLAFGGSSIIQDSTICASGYNVTSQSTCSGDSGGPLTVIDDDGKETQVGIASFVSATGCHTDIPAGFVRPGPYHEWYTEVTGLNFDWDPNALPESSEESEEVPETPESSEESEEASGFGPEPVSDEVHEGFPTPFLRSFF